jgi:hypothetical protein
MAVLLRTYAVALRAMQRHDLFEVCRRVHRGARSTKQTQPPARLAAGPEQRACEAKSGPVGDGARCLLGVADRDRTGDLRNHNPTL